MFQAKWAFLSIGHDADLFATETYFSEVIPGALRSFVAEYDVVISRPPFIAVALNLQHRSGVLSQPLGVVIEGLHSGIRQRPLIKPKEDILQTGLHSGLLLF